MSSSSAPEQASKFFLFRFPPELRLRLYKFIAAEASIIIHPEYVKYSNANLMRTCRQVAKESQWIFYRTSTLLIDNFLTLMRLVESPTPFFQECFLERPDTVRRLLCSQDDRHELRDLAHILCAACDRVQVQLATAVIAKMEALKARKDQYGHGLCSSIYHNKRELVMAMLNAGADIDNGGDCAIVCRNESAGVGYPLQVACRFGRYDIVKLLLENGADIQGTDIRVSGRMNPLSTACLEGQKDIVGLLLSRGADVNQISGSSGWKLSALAASLRSGQDEITDSLLARDAIFVDSRTNDDIIATACKGGSIRILETLLRGGATLGGIGSRNYLEIAAEHNHPQVIKWLLQRQAGVDLEGSLGPGGALKAACRSGHLRVSSILLEAGADVDIDITLCNEKHFSALQYAAGHGHLEIVQMLVQNGAKINAIGSEGTALRHAVVGNNEEIFRYLLARGADVNLPCYGWGRPLEDALESPTGNAIILCLLESGATVRDKRKIYHLCGNRRDLGEKLKRHDIRTEDDIDPPWPYRRPRLPRLFSICGGNMVCENYCDLVGCVKANRAGNI